MITQFKGVAVTVDSLVLWLRLSQQLNGWWWTGNKFPKHFSHAIYCKCFRHVSSLVEKVVDTLKERGRRAASVCCLDLLIVNLLMLFLLLLRPIYDHFNGCQAFCFIYLFIFKVTTTMTKLKKRHLYFYTFYIYIVRQYMHDKKLLYLPADALSLSRLHFLCVGNTNPMKNKVQSWTM